MAMCGFRTESPRIGLLIAMDIGHTLLRGAGRGSKTSLGDLRHFTMVAGLRCQEVVGVGSLDLFLWLALCTSGRCMRRRW
jgi:hypothetical protein